MKHYASSFILKMELWPGILPPFQLCLICSLKHPPSIKTSVRGEGTISLTTMQMKSSMVQAANSGLLLNFFMPTEDLFALITALRQISLSCAPKLIPTDEIHRRSDAQMPGASTNLSSCAPMLTSTEFPLALAMGFEHCLASAI